jgi:two-component system, chemotaxis family, response regulator WspF
MRIAIVNDMLLAVEAIRRIMLDARRDQIAWIARDGAEAVARCAEDTPDLILMDLIMPTMDGVEATRRIMAQSPCAIVVVTANVNDNSSKVFEAMGAGALDAVNTPVLERSSGEGAPLLAKIETIRRLIGNGGAKKYFAVPDVGASLSVHRDDRLVAIGASAGGPAALAKVLGQLTPEFLAAIVVVQHVDPEFVYGLASWLDQQTRLPVRIAEEGDRPQPGTVLLAGRDSHLAFDASMRLVYKAEPREVSFHPSIDVFFKSADRFWRGPIIGVILTGMGRDGAQGLLALKRSGHHTIAQDAASSAVYGMPKAVAELQAADEILPVDKIAPRLLKLTRALVLPHG